MSRTSTPSAPERTAAAPVPTAVRLAAEVFGTALLVLGGVGAALLASAFPDEQNPLGIGFLGVALAFGLSVLAGVAAVGHLSGGHFNPAVTVGLAVAGRTPWREVPGYVVAQLVGGLIGSTVLVVIAADGPSGFLASAQQSGFASNGYGEHSPGGFGLGAVLLAETVLTAVFVTVILSVTARAASLAPVVIGLTLTLIHLVSIPVSNTSVNPARSLAAAVYGGPDALSQLWVFVAAPLLGAAIAGAAHGVAQSRTRSLAPRA
ncbi:aquaporin Z [Rathayibacter sp. SD072]|uniref:aquaporin Z n=1 Tax=Rathayibacter sp. SD072 TaxID=2781731 RepID=UPI001A95FD04|nr:aquaporin Z [Rathayibacter sp. SD072]MBO0985165.1 aquaporin Z [Rathayibacter sp. SD072]